MGIVPFLGGMLMNVPVQRVRSERCPRNPAGAGAATGFLRSLGAPLGSEQAIERGNGRAHREHPFHDGPTVDCRWTGPASRKHEQDLSLAVCEPEAEWN